MSSTHPVPVASLCDSASAIVMERVGSLYLRMMFFAIYSA